MPLQYISDTCIHTNDTHTHTGNTRGVDVGADLDNKRYLSGVE
jgi:hypothetical protein